MVYNGRRFVVTQTLERYVNRDDKRKHKSVDTCLGYTNQLDAYKESQFSLRKCNLFRVSVSLRVKSLFN